VAVVGGHRVKLEDPDQSLYLEEQPPAQRTVRIGIALFSSNVIRDKPSAVTFASPGMWTATLSTPSSTSSSLMLFARSASSPILPVPALM
jgi:hypothetical protein